MRVVKSWELLTKPRPSISPASRKPLLILIGKLRRENTQNCLGDLLIGKRRVVGAHRWETPAFLFLRIFIGTRGNDSGLSALRT